MSNNALVFLHQATRQPMAVASLIPSSRSLSRQVSTPVPHSGDPVVVELGPGTGAFTGTIQTMLAGRGRHIAIEVNEHFTTLLAAQFQNLDVVTADARQLPVILAHRGLAHADVIVSGLPWAAFGPQQQQEFLDAITAGLSPEGAFTTFAYIHALWSAPARRFRRSLEDRFEEVVLGRTVWANLPPALVYHCRRPRVVART